MATIKTAVVLGTAVGLVAVVATCTFLLWPSANGSPVADAGEGLAVLVGRTATLDGAGSTDPEDDSLTYRWSIESRPEGSRTELADATVSEFAFTPDVIGEYVISLTVYDGENWSPPAEVTIVASAWFTDVTAEAGVPGAGAQDYRSGTGPGAAWGDYDNDGDLDLYVVCHSEDSGDLVHDPDEPNVLYRNNGDGTFSDVTALAGFGDPGVARGVAVADYDDDGDLDLYVVNADGANILYRNDIGSQNNWLKLRFKGKASNSGGVGVRVQVATDEWRQMFEVRSGSGYLAGNGPERLCGLGQITEVKGLTVLWPSGTVQHLRNVAVNQTLTITEPG